MRDRASAALTVLAAAAAIILTGWCLQRAIGLIIRSIS